MTNTALITGASSGIGLEFAKIHASKGGNLILVARSESKLNALKAELETQFAVQVTVIAVDLSHPNSAQALFEETEARSLQVDVLINNAGFGGHGKFNERPLVDEQAMMQVNMVTLTNLTHLYLQGMVARKQGKILNVSSTASFIPGPLQAVYYATKAYVTSFSQAVAEEVKDSGVTVTALCPGAVATGFVKAGHLEGVKAWDHAKTAKSVAEYGYNAMEKGKLVAFNDASLNFMLNWIIPFFPRKLVLTLSRRMMEKSK